MFAGIALFGLAISTAVSAQTPEVEPRIVPIDWPRPVYPQIAQSARVQGDVEVAVDVRRDGSVAAAEVVRGVPLLNQAVVDAARRARFECRGCGDALNRYSLYVTFRLVSQDQQPSTVEPLVVSPTQGWVTVIMPPPEVQPNVYYVNRLVRGPRCLYLWRCETDWGWSKESGPGPS